MNGIDVDKEDDGGVYDDVDDNDDAEDVYKNGHLNQFLRWRARRPRPKRAYIFANSVFSSLFTLDGPLGPEERYITLLLHNKVGRPVRVEPSRGRKGGYVVPENAFLKVSMIFPKTSGMPPPVTFDAKDLKTLNDLEINGDVRKVSIKPGEFPDEEINMTITAPGE